jgi:hypothetical protein
MLPMAMLLRRPRESEIQPPKICKTKGRIWKRVKKRPIWDTPAPRDFRYKGRRPPYMLPAILASTMANKNNKISLLRSGCRLASTVEDMFGDAFFTCEDHDVDFINATCTEEHLLGGIPTLMLE